MQKQHNTKLSTWLLWSPLKFAIMTFTGTSIISILYAMIFGTIHPHSTIPQYPILILCILVVALCVYFMAKKLPQTKLDQSSFVAIHNAQLAITSLSFMITSYLVIYNINKIIFNLMLTPHQSTPFFILATVLLTIFLLYLFGVLIANIFAKFRRIQSFNIPTWKIFLCMPFTFSALWIPGYILPSQKKSNGSNSINTRWYKHINEIILSHPTHTISAFIVITLLSGFLFGLNAILLTFTLALIFGIWALKSGTKQFTKKIDGKYTTTAIIINIILLIITCVLIFTPKTTQTVQINISDTQTITHQGDQ